ncbi:MAG: shikimate dehydrogenase [Planctomycetota bacterium]|jgi:3-dehydroquinate dehydratase/shikimate dehydrogenase
MATKLTIPIAAQNLEQAAKQISAAKAGGAEMLELRVDYLKGLSANLVKKLIAEAKSNTGQDLPIIVTCRDQRQGGAKSYSEQLRVDVLIGAVESGAEFIDFEYENFLSRENQEKMKSVLSKNPKTRLILSAHNFETKFADIDSLHADILQACPTAIAKLVYTAKDINDCFEGFDLLHKTSGERIVFCMGAAGLISRIIAKKLGSFVTFASIDDESATAPGQLTVAELRNLYRYDSINCDTELFGVIASPVAHSLSPAVHNACFEDIGANKLYLPLLVEGGKKGFSEFIRNVLDRKWLGFRGFSVTIPHKANAFDYVSGAGEFLEPLAADIGAINTLKVGLNSRISSYNTDYAGAMNALVSAIGIKKHELHNTAVAVIGAGGVGRAVVAGLAEVGAKITIYNRTVEKAQAVAEEFNCKYAGLDTIGQIDAQIVINCTSIGMYPNVDTSPLPQEYLKKDMVVFDTVYNPAETLLLKQAKQAGAKIIDGISMFVNQALAQFKIFTGREGNAEIMHKIVVEKFGHK